MSGHRQAAVALHAVGAADRRLILAELPAAERAILRGYLRELKELGFDGRDAAAVTPAPASASVPAPAAATAVERIAAASPATMHAIFRHEPASLTARFLARQHWPWAPAMLDLLPAAQREQIRAARPSGPDGAPARERFVFDAVLLRVDAAGAQTPSPRRTPPLAPWLRRVRSWIR